MAAFLPALKLEEYIWKSPTPCLLIPLLCLRRFIARRGKPTVVYSDNGTNFVGANHEMQECLNGLNQDKIASTLSQERIQWVFNPPAAPHMGEYGNVW